MEQQTPLEALQPIQNPESLQPRPIILGTIEGGCEADEYLFKTADHGERVTPSGLRIADIKLDQVVDDTQAAVQEFVENHPREREVTLRYGGLTEPTLLAVHQLAIAGVGVKLERYNTRTKLYESYYDVPVLDIHRMSVEGEKAAIGTIERHIYPPEVTTFLFGKGAGDAVSERVIKDDKGNERTEEVVSINVPEAPGETQRRIHKYIEQHPEIDTVKLYYSGLTEVTTIALFELIKAGKAVEVQRYVAGKGYESFFTFPPAAARPPVKNEVPVVEDASDESRLAEVAVAEAVMYAYSQNLTASSMYADEIPLNNWLREEAKEKGRELTYSEKITYGTREATANHCAENSFRSLYFINSQEKFANIFEKQAVLSSVAPPDDQAHRVDRWPWHYYALLKDKAGTYYAISPANYDPVMKENSLNTVISSKDLKEVLAKIKSMDGGWWPEAEYVEGVLAEIDTNVTIEQGIDHEYGTDWMKDMSMLEFKYDGKNSHRVANHSISIFDDEFYNIK